MAQRDDALVKPSLESPRDRCQKDRRRQDKMPSTYSDLAFVNVVDSTDENGSKFIRLPTQNVRRQIRKIEAKSQVEMCYLVG
jgi:hypothetical protein